MESVRNRSLLLPFMMYIIGAVCSIQLCSACCMAAPSSNLARHPTGGTLLLLQLFIRAKRRSYRAEAKRRSTVALDEYYI